MKIRSLFAIVLFVPIIAMGSINQEATHDEKGRITRKISEAGVVSEYTYHPTNGKLIRVSSSELKTEFSYDKYDNLIRATNSKGQVIDLYYDDEQHIQRMVSINHADNTRYELTFKYNATGKPTEISLEDTGKIEVEYDEKGEISKVSSNDGVQMALKVTQAFQNLLSVVNIAGVCF